MIRGIKIWPWAVLVAGLGVALALMAVNLRLPADGATGDLESFQPDGFHVQWLLEERPGGLRPGDVVVRAGGHTVDEWLAGAARGPEWRRGGTVEYDVVRAGRPLTLHVRLEPVPLRAVVQRWWLQFIAGGLVPGVAVFVLYKRPRERAARLMLLTCVALSLQYWGDAWNAQLAALPWGWPFWLQVAYEHIFYTLTMASILAFALVFPAPHPLMRRRPLLLPVALYLANPLAIGLAMALAGSPSRALHAGNSVSWVISIAQIVLAGAAGIRSARVARDPVTRAQVRWLLWGGAVATVLLAPGYALPALLGRPAPIPHAFALLLMILVPLIVALGILRYHLFDLEVVINRTLVYAALTVLLAGLYLLLVRLFTLVIPLLLRRQDDTLIVFASTLGIALAFAPLRRRVQTAIDRAFYRGRPDHQRLLPEMSARLATSIEPDQVAALLTEELPAALHIAWARLAVLSAAGDQLAAAGNRPLPALPVDHPLVAEARRLARPIVRLAQTAGLDPAAQDWLDRQRVELCIPLPAGAELIGLYFLGAKRSGEGYTGDEVRLLSLLGQQAAIAVQNSRLFQAEREQRCRAESLLGEKEVLLREIHHRVKNNLQIVSSLLYLQSRHIRDQETLDMFLESQHRVRSMALIHETLYQAGNLSSVNWDEYIRELAGLLYHSYGAASSRVRLTVDGGGVSLGVDVAVPCALIINELASNALKHAFPDGREGEIAIRMARDPAGLVTLVVADNGVGVPAGFDPGAGGSLGLQLVGRLVGQLGGALHVDTDHGSRFTITFMMPGGAQ